MNKGVVSYQFSCVGINFNNYKIEINKPPLLGFEIKANGSFLEIDVELEDIFEETTAFDLAHKEIGKLLDLICLKFMIKIGEQQKRDIQLPQIDPSETRIIPHNIYQKTSIDNIQLLYNPDITCLDSLKTNIEQYWDATPIRAISLFRNSLFQEDPVTKYLLLYNTLLFITAKGGVEHQKNVDNCISMIDSDVKKTISPHKNKNSKNKNELYETVYTRLRNEISHARKDTESQKTVEEITKHLRKFTEIVREILLMKLIQNGA